MQRETPEERENLSWESRQKFQIGFAGFAILEIVKFQDVTPRASKQVAPATPFSNARKRIQNRSIKCSQP